jgi:hypothetical protein
MVQTCEVKRDDKGRWIRGEHPYNFKGYGKGRIGLLIHFPEHPKANKATGQIPEYILRAEAALGKALPPGVVVHHHNHTVEQLVICQDQSYHLLLHKRTRALLACGHADWVKCWSCKEWSPVKLLNANNQHPSCNREYQRNHKKGE